MKLKILFHFLSFLLPFSFGFTVVEAAIAHECCNHVSELSQTVEPHQTEQEHKGQGFQNLQIFLELCAERYDQCNDTLDSPEPVHELAMDEEHPHHDAQPESHNGEHQKVQVVDMALHDEPGHSLEHGQALEYPHHQHSHEVAQQFSPRNNILDFVVLAHIQAEQQNHIRHETTRNGGDFGLQTEGI